jgi:hypothetical protein
LTDKPFDAQRDGAILAKELREEFLSPRGRKLSLDDQCAIKAATLLHHPPVIIAKAFGITEVSVSRIRNADFRRYPRVDDKLRELGRSDFINRYYTHDVQELMARARYEVRHGKPAGNLPPV